MHETALAEGLLRIVRQEAERCKVARVTDIHLRVGLLSAIEAHTLGACFEILAAGSVAESARLHVEQAPLSAHCANCDEHFTLTRRAFYCPHCESPEISFEGGHGCTIQSISAESAELEQEIPA